MLVGLITQSLGVRMTLPLPVLLIKSVKQKKALRRLYFEFKKPKQLIEIHYC